MSDQQLITGLAIIISGYSQIRCGLSLYHWSMVTNLAWFSSMTHIASLPFLQSYLRKHNFLWYTRILLIFGLATMLAVGLLLSGQKRVDSLATPTSCFVSRMSQVSVDTILSEIMLIGGFLARTLTCFPKSTMFFCGLLHKTERSWRRVLIWTCKKSHQSHRLVHATLLSIVIPSLTILISMQNMFHFLCSDICAVSWI